APTEKVPDTGFTPECSPATSVTSSPSPASATSSSRVACPGSATRLLVPTDGGLRYEDRSALPVLDRPARRAVRESNRKVSRRPSSSSGRRRRATPSPSKGELESPSMRVASSARRSSAVAISSPSRSAKRERPRGTGLEGARESVRVRQRPRAVDVRVHRLLDLGDARVRAGGSLGPQRQLDLALGREAIDLPRPEVAHDRGAGLLGQAVVLVGV